MPNNNLNSEIMKRKELEALKEYRQAFFDAKFELAQIYLTEETTNKSQKEQIMILWSNMNKTCSELDKKIKF